MPSPTVHGFSAEQKARLQQARQNSASGVPEVVLDAVVPGRRCVAGRDLQPFTPRVFAILRRFNSVFTGGPKPGDTAAEVDDLVRTIYVLTTPVNDVKAAAAQGIERLTEIAYDAVGESFELKDVPKIAEALAAHIAGGFATVPGGNGAAEDSAGPKDPAAAAPASAGGSA